MATSHTQKDPIILEFCRPATEITAITQFKGHIWIGTNKGEIIQTQRKDTRSRTENIYQQIWPNPQRNEPNLPIEAGSIIAGFYVFVDDNNNEKLLALIRQSGQTCMLFEFKKEDQYLVEFT